ncbi:Scr1 family TA system antitoxin-like transcriptional regulator [Kribbella sp. CA-294648]
MAALIRLYEFYTVPGLLQTPDYARTRILLSHDVPTRRSIGPWQRG